MKKILYALPLFFPLIAFASGVSFPQGLWVSNGTPELGEEISVFAVVTNSSDKEISGDVVFFDGTVQLRTQNFRAPWKGGYDVVSTPFTVTTGTHHLRAELRSAGGVTIAKTDELIVVAGQPSTEKGSQTFYDSASSTVHELVSGGETYLQNTAPGVVAGASTTYQKIEEFRIAQADALKARADAVYQEAEAEGRGVHLGPTASSTKTTTYKTVGKQFEYLAFAALAYIFSHRFWFYLIAILLAFWLVRKVISICRRLIRGRPDWD